MKQEIELCYWESDDKCSFAGLLYDSVSEAKDRGREMKENNQAINFAVFVDGEPIWFE